MRYTCLLITMVLLSCNSNDASQLEIVEELESLKSKMQTEHETRQFMQNYVRDLNDQNWPNKIGPYLRDSTFIEEHKKFREILTDYNFDIKYLTVDGTEGILWGTLTAIHSKEFTEGRLKGIPATNKKIQWDEVWYFTRNGDKFGEKFALLKDQQWLESFGL